MSYTRCNLQIYEPDPGFFNNCFQRVTLGNPFDKVKFMFSKKSTKNCEIFTVDLTLTQKCQINGEDFVIFCGLLRKHEL